jgi:hypothetical protein
MSEENIYYWKWKNTIIDFENISDEKADFGDYTLKKDFVFKYLGTPDKAIHEWKNGWYSSEYNNALKYAKELCLIEKYYDYDEELYEKDKEIERLQNIIDELENIMHLMIYQGYCAKTGKGTTATNFMATGENSEFGTRAKYILYKLKELKEK